MKRLKVSFSELMKRNKEEILNDKKTLEKIEERVEKKYLKSK